MKWLFIGALGGLLGIVIAAVRVKRRWPFSIKYPTTPPFVEYKDLLDADRPPLLRLRSDPKDRMWN